MKESLEEMSAFFDARCEIYDEAHVNGIDGGAESKRIPALYLPEHTKRILDLGIGTGLELEAIFARFPTIQVTGLDISLNMLQKLREKYPDKEIDLHHSSYLEYDFGTEQFDAIISVMTLHHYTHEIKTALYRKICQALNLGGVYVECDYMLSEHEFSDPQAEENALFAAYEQLRRKQKLSLKQEYHFDTPCTVPNQKFMLRSAGFTHVEEVWRRKNTVVLTAVKGTSI